ncbi:signal peptide peptidase SppA [Thermocrinis minervae]|uniref:Protease-4 n=1 Tax=Thermocrinis minervae TaxID=381751 RepID=A0A1M6THK3_9AQUI|nr:signal peptide peptidase SppA [Thermocrinis minervae]SHK56258.1 protease-4 [Thermocrinis minervae]
MRWIKRILLFLIILLMGIFLGSILSRIPVGERIAVLEIKGVITDSTYYVQKLEELRKDQSVKAIVLRVDSPGGSVGASQEIYRAVERVRKDGKPVVVSMGSVAASGGYYVSAPANYILANPGTITGSIGVIVQHIEYKQLLEKLGIKASAIKTGQFKDTLSPFRELTPQEREYLQKTIEDTYQQFLDAILRYRKIEKEKLLEVADGRILTGRQAKELGLVDDLGNIQDAIDKAKELAKVPQARVFYVGESKGILKKLMGNDMDSIFNGFMFYYLMR